MAVSDYEDSTDLTAPDTVEAPTPQEAEQPESERALVAKKLGIIRSDETFHDKAFKRMRKSMYMAFWGYDDTWSEKLYKANIAGRHVKQKTNALYAKNPTATATRKKRLDFKVWDENPKSLMMAFQITQAAQLALQQAAMTPPTADPVTGLPVPVDPQLPPGFEQAQAIIADFQQGTAYRTMVEKLGKTLEILFADALHSQKPLNFKMAAKALVRRACTCGVGYIELGFMRQYGPRPDIDAELSDARGRLDHLQRLAQDIASGEIDEDAAEVAELKASIEALMNEPEVVLTEGLTFDFPQSTKVVPDQLCTQLVGFVGARHVTIKYLFTCEQVEEMFPGTDIAKAGYRAYGPNGNALGPEAQPELPLWNEDAGENESGERKDPRGHGLVCVYKHYDKMSGLVYYMADGYKSFLRPPAAPDVFVEDFWPIYALTFNATESENELFPQSDVELIADPQMEHNRSRQGMREHRKAARPRWVTSKGLLDEETRTGFQNGQPFDVIEANKDPDTKIEDVLEVIPVPGVDPNLYQTEQFDQDRQIVVGASDANMGAVSKATATETTIAANASLASDDSSRDDLDDFLSVVARASSAILFAEMSAEQVMQKVGPGAVWPEQSLAQIANEMYLEVEAGSSGRPNQAVEIENFTKLAPILMQIPDLDKTELAKEGVRRLNDKLDVNKFILAGAPSIVAENQMMGSTPAAPAAEPGSDPNQQGAEGGQNAPLPPGPVSPGGGVPFGSNQVDRPAL